jgi:arginine decarboxylase
MTSHSLLGNRIPYEFFLTKGKGESDAGSEGLPYETGSYDEALNDAGIQNTNIIQYTSVIPVEAKEIRLAEGLKRIQWGEVMECIKAQSDGKRGEYISAAIMTTTITDPRGNYLGGFACEYSGHGLQADAEKSLLESIIGMIKRRGYGTLSDRTELYKDNVTDKKYIIHPGKIFLYDALKVKKEHGSVFTAICFVSYKYPHLSKQKSLKKKERKKRTKRIKRFLSSIKKKK